MKKNMAIIVLATALVIITSLTTSYAYAKLVKTATATAESASVASFGVTLTWGSDGLFSDSYATADGKKSVQMSDSAKGVAPGASGDTTLIVGGESELAVTIKVGIQASYIGWTVTDGTEYMPIVFTIKNGDNYLQDDGSFATAKTTYTMQEMSTLDTTLETIEAGVTLARTYTIGWEWSANTEIESGDYYICTQADGEYSVGDIIGAETYYYILSDEQIEYFSPITTCDELDSFLCSKSTPPTLTITLKATAEQAS